MGKGVVNEIQPKEIKLLTVTNKMKPVQHCYKMHGIYSESVV